MKTILQIENISKSYFHLGEDNFMLKELNLSIEKGKITALIGANGTGKTTLFNIIGRYQDININKSAKIIYDSKFNLLEYQPHQLANLGIGRLFQDAHIFPKLSILENMKVADSNSFGEQPYQSLFYNKKNKRIELEREQKALTILENTFGKESLFFQQPQELAESLSYGQQRLLGLARLLTNDYKLLLLDEPTAGVNAETIKKIEEIVLFLKASGKSVFYIEHNMNFVKKTADTVLFFNNCTIEEEGETKSILNNPLVKKHYLGINE